MCSQTNDQRSGLRNVAKVVADKNQPRVPCPCASVWAYQRLRILCDLTAAQMGQRVAISLRFRGNCPLVPAQAPGHDNLETLVAAAILLLALPMCHPCAFSLRILAQILL